MPYKKEVTKYASKQAYFVQITNSGAGRQ